MRVIAGSSRGRRLAEFKGRNIRPTPDRVREALFSILQSKLGNFDNLKVLDLFAGSGALAIESLSRGAAFACLVEKDTASIQVIRENLERCGMNAKAEVINNDTLAALKNFQTSFDLVFLDPPYHKGLVEPALTMIADSGLLAEQGVLCVETGGDETLPDTVGTLVRIDQRRYGSVVIHFYSISDEGLQ